MSSWAAFSAEVKGSGKAQSEGQRRDQGDRGGRNHTKYDQKPFASSASSSSHSSSSSSFLSLKAELANRASSARGSVGASKSGVRDREAESSSGRGNTLPAHLRPTAGVLDSAKVRKGTTRRQKHDRAGATSAWASTPSSQLDAARAAALECKAKLYDQLQRGKTGGLDEEQLRDSLIDWDRKEVEQDERESGADSDDEEINNLSRAQRVEDDDPMTDYEDDLGRTRRVPRSEVPREARRAQQVAQENEMNEEMVTYGPSTSFPVYRPDPTQRAATKASSTSGYKRDAPEHFDAAAFEKRHRGAGFYQFSLDEQERSEQMQALRRERDETMRAREINNVTRDGHNEGSSVAHAVAAAQDLGELRREAKRRVVEAKKKDVLARQRELLGLQEEDV